MKCYRAYSDKAITAALVNLRAQIIRDGANGLDHVEALLELRGVDLDGLRVPEKVPKQFRKGQLRTAILRALRDGDSTANEIAARVSNRPGTLRAVRAALGDMRRRGAVVVVSPARGRIRQVWGIKSSRHNDWAPLR